MVHSCRCNQRGPNRFEKVALKSQQKTSCVTSVAEKISYSISIPRVAKKKWRELGRFRSPAPDCRQSCSYAIRNNPVPNMHSKAIRVKLTFHCQVLVNCPLYALGRDDIASPLVRPTTESAHCGLVVHLNLLRRS